MFFVSRHCILYQVDVKDLNFARRGTARVPRFVHLQLLEVKFLFSKKHIFREQKRMAVYGRASLVSGFKLTREDDDLFEKHIFEVLHPVHEYTEMWIP